jgi:hypothetical protein
VKLVVPAPREAGGGEGGLRSRRERPKTWKPAKTVDQDRLTAKRERIADVDLPGWHARVQTMRNPIQRDGLLLALFTGLRSEDVRSIRFEHVDWSERSLLLPDPKGGVARAFKIPLSKTCVDILRRRRTENAESPVLAVVDGGFAFPALNVGGEVGPISDLRQQVHDGNKHARFPAEDVHTLRRTYESVAHEVGISEFDQHVLTNHAFASHNANATYIAQALPQVAWCQATIEAAPVQSYTDRGLGFLENRKNNRTSALVSATYAPKSPCMLGAQTSTLIMTIDDDRGSRSPSRAAARHHSYVLVATLAS